MTDTWTRPRVHPDHIHIASQKERGDPIVCAYCHQPVTRIPDPGRSGSYLWEDPSGSTVCEGDPSRPS